jgi:hypothetical protein
MKQTQDQAIATGLNQRIADLARNYIFNHWQIDSYKLTGSNYNDTNYVYDLYVRGGKHVTNAQQLFINGLIAGLKLALV